VELFEAILREYEFGVGTIQGVARRSGVHRRMAPASLGSAAPVEKAPATRPRPRLETTAAFMTWIPFQV